MIEIVGIKAVVIINFYNFACEDMVSKPMVVDLEQGGLVGGLAHWAVNPSIPKFLFINFRFRTKWQRYRIHDPNNRSSLSSKTNSDRVLLP